MKKYFSATFYCLWCGAPYELSVDDWSIAFCHECRKEHNYDCLVRREKAEKQGK